MIKVGREEPAISMDVNGGKIIWAKHSEMQQVNLKALPEGNLLFRNLFQMIFGLVQPMLSSLRQNFQHCHRINILQNIVI